MKKHKLFKPLFGPVATKFYTESTGTWRTMRPVVNQTQCAHCSICAEYCPTGVISVSPEGDHPVRIDLNNCKGCGICTNLCPRSCIQMINEGEEHA